MITFRLNSGGNLPAIGYGTWQSAGEPLEKALHAVLETGYRHIDTAAAYFNEATIGKVINEWISSGKIRRDEIFVTTKLPFHANRPKSVEKYMLQSLKFLKLDYVDLYLIHAPFAFVDGEEFFPKDKNGKIIMDPTTDHAALWKAMEAQVDAGRTKAIGVCNFNVKQMEKLLTTARIKPAVLQLELHLYFQQKDVYEFCRAKDIQIMSYSSLGSPGTVKNFGKGTPSIMEDPEIQRISRKHNKSPAQVILRFLVQKHIAVIPKSTNPKRIKENFEIGGFELDKSDIDKLGTLDKGLKGQVVLFRDHFPGIEKHPEFPYPN